MNKKEIIIGCCGLAIGFAIGAAVFVSNNKYKKMVKEARMECIEYNKEHNQIYNVIMKNYLFQQDEKYGLAGSIMLELDFPHLMSINKALGIDCKKYGENGKVIMSEQNGKQYPMEGLPDELKLL